MIFIKNLLLHICIYVYIHAALSVRTYVCICACAWVCIEARGVFYYPTWLSSYAFGARSLPQSRVYILSVKLHASKPDNPVSVPLHLPQRGGSLCVCVMSSLLCGYWDLYPSPYDCIECSWLLSHFFSLPISISRNWVLYFQIHTYSSIISNSPSVKGTKVSTDR